jgi:hypothetical protein
MHRVFQGKRRWVSLALLLVLVTGCLAAVFYARPVYRKFKTHRAHHLIADIQSYYLSGDWQGYEQRLLTAGNLSPGDEKVMQAQARYLAVRAHPIALELWRRLVLGFPRNPENWDGLFLTSLQLNDPKMAALGLEGYRRSAPGKLEAIRRHEIKWLAMIGRSDEAIAKAQPLFRTGYDETDRGFLFQTAQLFFQRGNSDDRAMVRKWLKAIATEEPKASLDAWVILTHDPDLTPENARIISSTIKESSEATISHLMLATLLDIRFGAESQDPSMVWYQLASGRSIEDRIQIATWLQQRRDFVSSTMIIQSEEALQHRDAAIIHLSNLEAGLAWEEIRRFVRERDCPLPPVLKQLYLARAAAGLGLEQSFATEWRRAMQQAQGNPVALGYLANMAETHGWDSEAEAACRELTRTRGAGMRGWVGLFNLGRKKGDETLMKEALSALNPST